jgi:DNA-binding response OmpR family regulator
VAFVAAFNAEEECVGLESAAIVAKPFDLDELLGAVRTQLPVAAT